MHTQEHQITMDSHHNNHDSLVHLGYPLVAKGGGEGRFVCPSMFRDLCDYVYDWPFEHFREVVFLPLPVDVID